MTSEFTQTLSADLSQTVGGSFVPPSSVQFFDGDSIIKIGRDGTLVLGAGWTDYNEAATAFFNSLVDNVMPSWKEAVRAEQAADIERLKSHLEDAKEIIQKQMKQAAELAKFKALAETLAGALGEIAQPDYGYTDILERGCPPEKHIDYFCSMVTWRQRTAREALTSYKEARDD